MDERNNTSVLDPAVASAWGAPMDAPPPMELTVASEGMAAPPTTLEWKEENSTPLHFVALMQGKSLYHKLVRGSAIALALGYVGFLLFVITTSHAGRLETVVMALCMLFPFLLPYYVGSKVTMKGRVMLSGGTFQYREEGIAAGPPILLGSAMIHGFGYQSHGRFRGWKLVAIMRTGVTVPIAIPSRGKSEARWIARRLNAALAASQTHLHKARS